MFKLFRGESNGRNKYSCKRGINATEICLTKVLKVALGIPLGIPLEIPFHCRICCFLLYWGYPFNNLMVWSFI